MGTRYANYRQRAELSDSITKTERMLNDPYLASNVKRKDEARKNLQLDKQKLDAISPPPLETAGRRKALMEREKQLREAMILGNPSKGIEPMPSKRMMTENPSGSTGKHIRWEKYWKGHSIDDKGNPIVTKDGGIFKWKDTMRELHQDKEMDDADIANIETFRPDQAHVPLADSRVPRSYGLSMQAKANYDDAVPGHVPTAVEARLAGDNSELPADSASDINRPATWQTCQATTRKNGEICGRPTKDNKPYCFYANHKRQFETEPEA